MTTNPQEQQAMQETMDDEAFRTELRAWLAEHLTDTFREQRTMHFSGEGGCAPRLAKDPL